MTISAKIIADSVSPQGHRLTTFQLRYPRFIHAEFMTHRQFSRNASSSRAIPVKKMIEDIRRDPAMPIYWGSNKPGMQAGEEISGTELEVAKGNWLASLNEVIQRVQVMTDTCGLHKQIANRMLEPWAHINVVVTATSWSNFFALRAHSDAQPEIKALAEAMQAAMADSVPQLLQPGEWHLPYVSKVDYQQAVNHLRNVQGIAPLEERVWDLMKKVSVARCARVSYRTHDGRFTTVEEDVALYEKLVVSQPLHASPAEHQATPDEYDEREYPGVMEPMNLHQHGNFTGWRQLRKMLANEYVETPLYKGATL